MPPKHKHTSAVQKLFSQYITYIAQQIIISEHAKSYMTPTESRNKWRVMIDYKPEVEEFLIQKTKVFIRLLDLRDSNSTNPVFLKSFVNLVADYLSGYTAHNKNVTRRSEVKRLTKVLWDENSYIQGLLAAQRQKRIEPKTKHHINQKRKQKRAIQAKHDFDVAREVSMIFIEVSHYKKK